MEIWTNVVLPALEGVLQDILSILPRLIAAVFILLVGWLIAKLLENVVRRLLKRIGFNGLAEKTGISNFLKNAGFQKEVTWIVGRLVYWLLLLIFLLSAAETLQLDTLALTIQKVVSFIPSLVLVIFILVFGAMLAKLAGRLVRASAIEAELEFADFLGKFVNNVVLIVILVLAVSQLDIDASVLDTTFAALIGAAALTITLTLGLGSRNISYNILCGVYARRTFEIGQYITVKNTTGTIVKIGSVNTTLETSDGLINLPNRMLIENKALMPKTSGK